MTSLAFYALFAFVTMKGESVSILTVDNHNFHEHAHDDGWGQWGKWQPCSRTCGGGVSYMKRECLRTRSNGEPGCQGSDKMYTSCSIQDCPVDAIDFRTLQCAEHNNVTYRGQRYDWIPYTGEAASNRCELFCQPRTRDFFLKIADKVVDGTRCHATETDVCVDGICQAVGCDMLLGSNLKSDVCGECGGDGTSCYPVKGSVTAKLPLGYIPLILIPPGATEIEVRETKASKNFLAIRDSGKKYILNGHWQINSSTIVQAGGSTIVYHKSHDRKRALESIKMKGPTFEMLYIDVLVQDRNRGIEYSFYLPHGIRDLNSAENQWFADRWQPCTSECGGGAQKRKVVCKDSNSGERAPNYRCYTQPRPQSTRKCNTHPCGARWLVGDWETCNKRCGGGVQTRQVTCIRTSGGLESPPFLLPDEGCSPIPKAETRRDCGADPCPEWLVGEWSTCSVSCGDGVQRRQVQCPSSNLCDETSRPLTGKACNRGPCSGIHWFTTEWSECTGICKRGYQSRQVSCGTTERVHFPESLCDSSNRPEAVRNCSSDALCPEQPTWVAEEWSECSVTCGIGSQIRRVFCALHGVGHYRIIPEDNCLAAKPAAAKDCSPRNCTTSWYIGSWGPCSASCNGGFRSRVVLCVGQGGSVLGDDDCRLSRPSDTEECSITPCGSAAGETAILESSFESPRRDERLKIEDEVGLGSPQASSERCLLPSDPGTCDYWTVYWYFNTEAGLCDRFWYGGCDGNGNRFETRDECSRICDEHISSQSTQETTTRNRERASTVSSTTTVPQTLSTRNTEEQTSSPATQKLSSVDPNNIPSFSPDFDVSSSPPKESVRLPPPLCYLRKSAGPCSARIPRWHFDGASGRCVSFWYGGCAGNENNFANEENCVQICGTLPVPLFTQGHVPDNTPPIPVQINPGRSEVFAEVGEMARLACMAEGSPVPTVTWRRVGEDTPELNERSEVLEDYSLILSKITIDDQGTYECTASNGLGPQQTWKVNLIVKEHLLIRETPSDTEVHVGEPAALRCRIHEDVLFFTWYREGKKMQTDDQYYRIQPWGDLHILQADVRDSGTYTCTAYSPDASQSASARLIVSQREQPPTTARPSPESSSAVAKPALRRPIYPKEPSIKQCKDYPEYANCNIVVLKRMCHKHNYARYCCASCGGEPSTPPTSTRRRLASRRHNARR